MATLAGSGLEPRVARFTDILCSFSSRALSRASREMTGRTIPSFMISDIQFSLCLETGFS